MTTLTGRPLNPSEISFDSRCFAPTGEVKTEYVVFGMAPRYPTVFADKANAEAFAKSRSAEVTVRHTQVMARVSWTLS